MATPRQIEANRRNAEKSTGPQTDEGKERSRFNAFKHGMSAKHDVLPGEDEVEYRARIQSWKSALRPTNSVENFLAERVAKISWQLDRVERAHRARRALRMHSAGVAQAYQSEDEVEALGMRLFWDPRGPLALYPHVPSEGGHNADPLVSWSGTFDDQSHPKRIVLKLESTGPGCHWLLSRWSELGSLIVQNQRWQSPDKLRAIRLLGRQPLEVLDDPRVAGIFLACHVIDPSAGDLFHEISMELTSEERTAFQTRLAGRRLDGLRPSDEPSARDHLFRIVDDAMTRILQLAETHRRNADLGAELENRQFAFDDTQTGERMRRHETSCGRTLLKTLQVLARLKGSNEPNDGPDLDVDPEMRARISEPDGELLRAQNQGALSTESSRQNAARSPISVTSHRSPVNSTPAPAPATRVRNAGGFENSPNEPNLGKTLRPEAFDGHTRDKRPIDPSWADRQPMRERPQRREPATIDKVR